MKNNILSLLLFFFSIPVFAQKTSGNVLAVNMTGGIFLPQADLKQRFGQNFSNGVGLEIIKANGFLYGINADFMYGKKVKEDILSTLYTREGYIVGKNLSPADVFLRERGIAIQANFGYIWQLNKSPHLKGIRTSFGIGFLQHKIRIQDDSRTVSQLTGDYLKGYDRLTNGLMLEQFVGYQYISQNRRINFFGGLEFFEAFTQNQRNWNWDTRQSDKTKRIDILTGLKIGWILPFYLNDKGEDYSY